MNEFLSQLYWRESLWLLLALFPLFIMAWKRLHYNLSLKQYADVDLLPWITLPLAQRKTHWKNIQQFSIWILLAFSAAGPRLLISAPDENSPPQSAAIIIVDHSRSMQANDVFPNRQAIADRMVEQWTQANKNQSNYQQKNNLELGLVIFSGASHIMLPATFDMNALHESALLLSKIQLPTHGSAITESLLQSQLLLKNISGERTIILLTDGDIAKNEFIQLKNTINELQQDNITLHILGVGLPSPVALTDTAGHWLKFNNKAVQTRLKENELRQLSKNIIYARLNPDTHNKLSNVWQPARIKISEKNQNKASWNELFYWPLLAAILLMFLNQLSLEKLKKIQSLTVLFLSFILLLPILPINEVHANNMQTSSETLNQAYQAWKNQNYTHAAELYSQAEGYMARMGEGASCFRTQQIECAITSFSRAAWEAENDTQRGQAAFNLANSFFKQGDFKSAILLYKDALRYQPEQKNYKKNLDFTIEVQQNIERYLRLLANRDNNLQEGLGDIESVINFNNDRVSTMDINSSRKSKDVVSILSKPGNLTEQQLATYLLRQQNFVKLSVTSKSNPQQKHDWSRFSNDNPAAANKIAFWQRLFELEEGIPAHPQTPKVIQGVRPW
jgi:Ca-activated chloride channel homolog